jgi:uncharacterized protein
MSAATVGIRRAAAVCLFASTGLAAAAAPCAAQADHRLLDAVKRRDHKTVRSLVQAHVDVNAAQPDGATPLAWAVDLDDPDMTDALLAAGADVNAANEYGESPLTLACANGDGTLIARLLKAGAAAGAARSSGETALMIAAGAGSVDGVEQLAAAGAPVNALEPQRGQTALMWAAAEGHADVVQALIGLGADVKAVSKSGYTPLLFAAAKNDAAAVRDLLAAGADANDALPAGATALTVAMSQKSTRAAAALIEGGAAPNVTDRSGSAPLHTAAELGDVDLVKALLAKGAVADVRTARTPASAGGRGGGGGGGGGRTVPGERTPLQIAAKTNHEDVMRALVAAGADPSLKAQDGTTLLMAAAGSGHVGVVKYAYELDPHVDAINDAGATVIHASVTGTGGLATQAQICQVIQFLADHGAKLDETDAAGRTPIQIADILPIDKAVNLLTELIVKSGATPKVRSKR